MYARSAGNKTLTFGVSGQLWNRSLIMYDRETNSLWSHLLGEAMDGPLKGEQLRQIPSVMTDWESWSQAHPDGTVLWMSRTSVNFRRDFYRRPSDFVLAISGTDHPKAWSLESLRAQPVLNESFDGQPVLVAFDQQSVTARLFSRRLNEHELMFEIRDGKLTDRETKSTWNPVSGKAASGPWNGQSLRPLPAIMSYRRVWKQFHPESEFVD